MLENRISGMPVVDENKKVVGLLTQTDIFKVMISISGAYRSPIQVAFDMEDRPGSLHALINALRNCGARVVSVLTSHDHMPAGRREVYVRLQNMADNELNAMIDDLKKDFKVLYVIREDLSNIPKKAPKQ
jgi:acetoin utilization protein AcuB